MDETTLCSCELSSTKYCKIINAPSCEDCPLRGADHDEAEANMHYIDGILEHLPPEGVRDLHTSPNCLLCRDEDKNPTNCFAFTDIGHEEVERDSRRILGRRMTSRKGAFLPIAISCCKRCRGNYRKVAYLPTILSLFISALALVLLSIREIREPLIRVAPYLPVLVFVGAVGVGILVGVLLRRFLLERLSMKTQFDVFKLDKLRMLRLNGWFDIYREKYTSHLVFRPNMPNSGFFMAYDGKDDEPRVIRFDAHIQREKSKEDE